MTKWGSPGAGSQGVATASDGAAIHYAVHGTQGPFVILLHGWCCSQAFWRFQTESLSDRYHLVALDLPGHGAAATTARRRWSMETLGRDAAAVADVIGADRLALVGHSMGGPAALEAALRLGDRCVLTLGVDTFTDPAFYRRRPNGETQARVKAFADDFAGAMEAMVRRITLGGVERGVADWIVGAMAGAEPRIALPLLESLLDWDIEARWPLLQCPVETINSTVLAMSSEPLALAGLRVQGMDAVGHFPMLEDPERFNALARAALERHGLR